MSQRRPELTSVVGTVDQHTIMNWNGFGVLAGYGKSTFILDEIEYRRRHVKQNMLIFVGEPGEGKSYFALRLGEILDPRFNPFMQVVFERTHLLWLIGANSPLKMGQVILIDEAQFIAGSRRWYEDVQKDVMEHIEAIRSRGFVVLIVALHLNLLDKIIRKYVLSHMMVMSERGKAIVYKLYTPPFKDELFKRRLGRMALQIPDYDVCQYPSCLLCKFQTKCMTNRAIYERLKKEFLGKMSAQSQHKAEANERRKNFINFDDTLTKVLAHTDQLVFAKNGKVEIESVRILLEDTFHMMLTDVDARRLIKRGAIKYPNVFTRQVVKAKDTKKMLKL